MPKTSKFSVMFDTVGAAFEDRPGTEIGRILRQIATQVEDGAVEGIVRDINGDIVGAFSMSPHGLKPRGRAR